MKIMLIVLLLLCASCKPYSLRATAAGGGIVEAPEAAFDTLRVSNR